MDPKRALKDYAYRFGSIETSFKNDKTNGFYLETTHVKNLKVFTTLYGIVSIAKAWLTILGSDYQKNSHHYRKHLDIKYSKKIKSKHLKILSLFNLGLTIFNKVYEVFTNFVLKFNFKLYDV